MDPTSQDIFVLPRARRILHKHGFEAPSSDYITFSHFLERFTQTRKKVYIVPNYPQKRILNPGLRNPFRKLQRVEHDKKVILFVGKLSTIEGVGILPSITEELTQKTRAAQQEK